MFHYQYPLFEKKNLLRTEMLEQLRDNPRTFLSLYFGGYGDGVLSGCEVTWKEDRLTISPGIISRGGKFYFLDDIFELDCKSRNELCFLKIQFLTEEKDTVQVSGNTRIFLDDKQPDLICEMELGRFHFQEGARLRDTYESFEDFSTEYDTINRIFVPYAVRGGSSLHAEIIKQFALEMMREKMENPYDINFSMMALAADGELAPLCVREYIRIRLGNDKPYPENGALYQGLLEIRRNGQTNGKRYADQGRNRKILLV